MTRFARAARQMHLFRGLFPLVYTKEERDPDWPTDVDDRISYGMHVGKNRGFIHPGDFLIVITGWRQGKLEWRGGMELGKGVGLDQEFF